MSRVYNPDASPAFNAWMDDLNGRIAAEVREVLGDDLLALILGGGYGHGEGGLVIVGGKERPYNDLDYTLVVRRKHAGILPALEPLRAKYGAETGIHVDFSRPLTLKDVRHLPHWMMWFDLVQGHIVLDGPEDILTANAPCRILEPLPLIEGTRLLLNRGAGLVWSRRVLAGLEPEPDDGFVRRNYQKAVLALGDALLVAWGRYQTAYTGRDELLRRLAGEQPEVAAFGLVDRYAEALAFKFRPDRHGLEEPGDPELAALAELWAEVFLYVESRRMDQDWSDMDAYVAWPGLREPEEHTPVKLVRNLVHNLRLGGPGWKYPRESLYPRLPVLLGATRRHGSEDWEQDSRRFLELWNRFN